MEGPESLVTHRHASWLELFFDLIFVASIGVISHSLLHAHEGEIELRQLVFFALEFMPVWWIWASYTLYSNRFGCDNRVQKYFTLVIIFLLVNLAAIFGGSVSSFQSTYILLYISIRIVISFLYMWTLVNSKRDRLYVVRMYFSVIFGSLMSAASLFAEDQYRSLIFYLSVMLEMVMVVLISAPLRMLPVHRAHLVERIGLMTMILLGESIISIVANIQIISGKNTNFTAMTTGFIMIGAIWWIYYGTFYLLEGAKRITNGIVLLYSHLIFSIGLVILASLIGLTISNSINSTGFKILAIVGMSLFYLGKQISYFMAYPVYRVNNVVNSLVCVTITVVSTYLPNPTFSLVGVTVGMLTYVYLNFIWTLRKDVDDYFEG